MFAFLLILRTFSNPGPESLSFTSGPDCSANAIWNQTEENYIPCKISIDFFHWVMVLLRSFHVRTMLGLYNLLPSIGECWDKCIRPLFMKLWVVLHLDFGLRPPGESYKSWLLLQPAEALFFSKSLDLSQIVAAFLDNGCSNFFKRQEKNKSYSSIHVVNNI